MKVIDAKFYKSVFKKASLPTGQIPEIAFSGRSNVGKSSLINTLINRKGIAKTSSTPGRTQSINFIDINNSLYFVDLPGYGYAKVPVSVTRNWGPMIETYLKGRETLKAVVLIMDVRRIPGIEEQNFIDWLKLYQRKPVLVLTKADKLSKSAQKKQRQAIGTALDVNEAELILFSAKTRLGKPEVWSAIERAVFDEHRERN